MRKGRTLAGLTTGMMVIAVAAACGGDAPEGTGEAAAPPAATTPPAQTPSTVAPGGDATVAAGTDTGAAAAPAAGAAAGGDAALVSRGQQVFAGSICVSCHGPSGAGTPLAPSMTDSEWLWVDPAGDMQAQVAEIIKTGIPQPKDPAHVAPMLPYGGAAPMPEEDVQALAAYVVSLSGS